jgi:act minimal PKS chain-length factor (CLF/KS beta)
MTTAVVTGLGIVAPTGIGIEAHWSATVAGRSAIGPITRFDPGRYPVRLAGQVPAFDARDHIAQRLIVQTDHWTHLSLAATELALTDAGVVPAELPEYDMAVVTASSSGGTEFGQREIERLWSRGPVHVTAYQSIAWFYAASTGQISIRYGMRGPCGVIASEQAGGLDVFGQARRVLRSGARLVVSGGTDASLCPYGLVAQLSNGRLSQHPDPDRAYAPFGSGACGYLPGEGGAIVIVEDAEHAATRSAPRVYGEIAGYAATFDPPAGSARPPGLRRAMELAIADAGLVADDIDVVFADGTATREADRAEAGALAAVFGPRGKPVTVPKGATGRLYAGLSLDVATALLSIRDGVIPPTVGVTEPGPEYKLDLVVGEARPARLRTALVLARGYGGFNAALVVRGAGQQRLNGRSQECSPSTTSS